MDLLDLEALGFHVPQCRTGRPPFACDLLLKVWLYGYFERYQLYLIVAAICLFQLLISKPWLDRYRFGPLEWIWRSLTYLEKQPMVRQSGAS